MSMKKEIPRTVHCFYLNVKAESYLRVVFISSISKCKECLIFALLVFDAFACTWDDIYVYFESCKSLAR